MACASAFASVAISDEPLPTSLCELGEELLLAVLQFCQAHDLSRVARTCKRFAAPSALEHSDGQPLSLTERAARSTLARALASRPMRAYEKGAAESHMQALLLLECGLLERGVLHDVPFGVLRDPSSGWKLAYQAPYSHRTCEHNLDTGYDSEYTNYDDSEHIAWCTSSHQPGVVVGVPDDARYVFLGAVSMTGATSRTRYENGHALNTLPDRADLRSGKALVFSLCAWGRRDTVFRDTHGSEFTGGRTSCADNEEDGVCYYRWSNHAMLLLDHHDLGLAAHTVDLELSRDARRRQGRLGHGDLHG